MHKITPCLWFDGQAEEAARFYVSVFEGAGQEARVVEVNRMGGEGAVMLVVFELAGQRFMGLNGGPEFHFDEAVSFFVDCADQAEVDYFWDRLTADGGEESMCGWLKDKYGLSWQIIPRRLMELNTDPDPARAQRSMQAMLQMRKIDVAALEAA